MLVHTWYHIFSTKYNQLMNTISVKIIRAKPTYQQDAFFILPYTSQDTRSWPVLVSMRKELAFVRRPIQDRVRFNVLSLTTLRRSFVDYLVSYRILTTIMC